MTSGKTTDVEKYVWGNRELFCTSQFKLLLARMHTSVLFWSGQGQVENFRCGFVCVWNHLARFSSFLPGGVGRTKCPWLLSWLALGSVWGPWPVQGCFCSDSVPGRGGYCLDPAKPRKAVLNRRECWTLANRVTTVHRLHVLFRAVSLSWVWWPTPLILSLKRHRQAVL